jgi:hypothetical protein
VDLSRLKPDGKTAFAHHINNFSPFGESLEFFRRALTSAYNVLYLPTALRFLLYDAQQVLMLCVGNGSKEGHGLDYVQINRTENAMGLPVQFYEGQNQKRLR